MFSYDESLINDDQEIQRISIDKDDIRKVIINSLNVDSYGATNYGVKEGFQVNLTDKKMPFCTFTNNSKGERRGSFYIYNNVGTVKYSGEFDEHQELISVTVYGDNKNYMWKKEGFDGYEYCYVTKDEGSLYFNVNKLNRADGECKLIVNGKSTSVYYYDGNKYRPLDYFIHFGHFIKSYLNKTKKGSQKK